MELEPCIFQAMESKKIPKVSLSPINITPYLKRESIDMCFVCDYCKEKFETKCSLAHHIKYLHSKRRPKSLYEIINLGSDRLYLCNFCDESSVDPDVIVEHVDPLPDLSNPVIKGHKDYYFCDLCKENFETEKEMLVHKWTHYLKSDDKSSDAQKSCNESCDAQKSCNESSDTRKSCNESCDAQKSCKESSNTQKSCNESSDTQKSCDESSSTQKSCNESSDTQKSCDESSSTETSCNESSDTQKSCNESSNTQKSCYESSDAQKSCNESGDAQKSGCTSDEFLERPQKDTETNVSKSSMVDDNSQKSSESIAENDDSKDTELSKNSDQIPDKLKPNNILKSILAAPSRNSINNTKSEAMSSLEKMLQAPAMPPRTSITDIECKPKTWLEKMLSTPADPPKNILSRVKTYKLNEIPEYMLKPKVVLQRIKINGTISTSDIKLINGDKILKVSVEQSACSTSADQLSVGEQGHSQGSDMQSMIVDERSKADIELNEQRTGSKSSAVMNSTENSGQSTGSSTEEKSLMIDKVATGDVSSTQDVDDDDDDEDGRISPGVSIEETLGDNQSSSEQTDQSVESLMTKVDNRADQLTGLLKMMKIDFKRSSETALKMHKSYVRSIKVVEYMENAFDSIRKSEKDKVTVVRPKEVTADVQKVAEMKGTGKLDGDVEKGNEDKGNVRNQGEGDDGDEDKEASSKTSEHIRSFVLPAEYDPNDSRWTLKYRDNDPKLGLVELVPDSNVFVDPIQLAHCKRVSKDSKALARKLLSEIFTQSALSVCSLTGARANAFYSNGSDIRPGLDENARLVMLSYVEDYAREKKWGAYDGQSVINSLRSRMHEIRYKHGKTK